MLIGELRETEPTGTVAEVVLKAIVTSTYIRRSAVMFGGEIVRSHNVDMDVVCRWLGRWQPPQLTPKGFDRDRKDLQFPIRFR